MSTEAQNNSMPSSLISKERAIKFTKDILLIPNIEELILEDKLCSLNTIIGQWFQIIPFQSLRQISIPDPKPMMTVKDALEDILSGFGGLCFVQANGMYHVLAALGYSLTTQVGSVTFPDDHFAVIARNVQEEGDMFLLDVGSGHPTFNAIPIKTPNGFINDSGPITESFCTYRYIVEGDQILRFHHTTKTENVFKMQEKEVRNFDDQLWVRFCVVLLEPKSLSYIWEGIHRTICSDKEGRFNTNVVICSYPERRYTGIMNSSVLREGPDNKLKQEDIADGINGVYDCVKTLFPDMPDDIVKHSLSIWTSINE